MPNFTLLFVTTNNNEGASFWKARRWTPAPIHHHSRILFQQTTFRFLIRRNKSGYRVSNPNRLAGVFFFVSESSDSVMVVAEEVDSFRLFFYTWATLSFIINSRLGNWLYRDNLQRNWWWIFPASWVARKLETSEMGNDEVILKLLRLSKAMIICMVGYRMDDLSERKDCFK